MWYWLPGFAWEWDSIELWFALSIALAVYGLTSLLSQWCAFSYQLVRRFRSSVKMFVVLNFFGTTNCFYRQNRSIRIIAWTASPNVVNLIYQFLRSDQIWSAPLLVYRFSATAETIVSKDSKRLPFIYGNCSFERHYVLCPSPSPLNFLQFCDISFIMADSNVIPPQLVFVSYFQQVSFLVLGPAFNVYAGTLLKHCRQVPRMLFEELLFPLR